MKHQQYHLLFIVLLLTHLSAAAQSFCASHLQTAARRLDITNQLSAVQPGQTLTIIAPNGQVLNIRADEKRWINHIGIPLFSIEMRTLMPSPVYDYLEYALLNHKYRLSENTLQEQKLRFRSGSWDTLQQLHSSDECSISNRDNKWYIVTWNRNGEELVSLLIPIEYELLANSNRREMEQNLARNLSQHHPTMPTPSVSHIALDDLQKITRDGVYVKKGESYLLSDINTDTYYVLEIKQEKIDSIIYEDEVIVPLCSARHPDLSLANILLGLPGIPTRATLQLELLYTGYQKEQVEVSIDQWLSFFRQQGCTPYYIFENSDADIASAILFMYNQNAGYAHLAYLHSSITEIGQPQVNIKGKVYMYIPTSNIHKLFDTAPSGKSTVKHYEP